MQAATGTLVKLIQVERRRLLPGWKLLMFHVPMSSPQMMRMLGFLSAMIEPPF
ncbi:hypothetical protein SBDP1_220023 [Syntrophobacter sp. SbD1]|nr:hypothetical protein SBDP1_220023 [Syntrophobacter sp. SbD1]